MAGEKNRKMEAPRLFSMLIEINTLKALDRQVNALSKQHGFRISRSDLIREVINNYLNVAGV